MKSPQAKTKRKKPLILTLRDENILRAIYAYRYMTALDVAWLLFKPTSRTHVVEILSMLAGGDDLQTHSYLCRFGIPSRGNMERFFTLGAKGRTYLAEKGLPMPYYFRPYKLRNFSHTYIKHTLLVTRFVVAAHIWIRQQTEFNLLEVRFGHEFRKAPVVPDAWLLFERVSNGNKIPIFLEIDRGMEYQKRFKEQHILSRIKFYEDGSYTRMFGSQSVRIVYATTGQIPQQKDGRRESMRKWTNEVLKETRRESWADVFQFASVSYESLFDLTIFDRPVWFRPDSPAPMTLLTP